MKLKKKTKKIQLKELQEQETELLDEIMADLEDSDKNISDHPRYAELNRLQGKIIKKEKDCARTIKACDNFKNYNKESKTNG